MELPSFGPPRLKPVLLGSSCDRPVRRRFCVLRSATFVVARFTVPDVESYLSRQAELVHGRREQHVPAGFLAFRPERLPLLCHEGEHFVVRRATCACDRSRARLLPSGRCWPAPPAIVRLHREVRPERMSVEVECPVAEAHFSAVVPEVKVASTRDRSRRLLAPFAAKERNPSGSPSVQHFIGRCGEGHGRLVQARCRPDPFHAPDTGHRPNAIRSQKLRLAACHDPDDCLGDRPPC